MRNLLHKYKNMSIQTKSAAWFILCSFLQKGISFITVPLFTRLLSTKEYGTYTLYLSWLQVFTVLTSLYMYYGVLDNAMAKFEDDRDRYVSAMQGLTTVIWVIVFTLTLILYPFFNKIIGLPLIFICLMFIEMFFTPAINYWMGKQRFKYSYKSVVVVTLLDSLCNPILGFIFIFILRDKNLSLILATVLTESCLGFVLLLKQYKNGKCFFDKKYWIYSVTLALPMIGHYLSGIILNQGDRIMINQMVGKSAVAMYGVAYSIGMLVQILVTGINSSMTPWLYAQLKKKNFKDIQNISTVIMLLIAAVAIILMMISPEAVLVFGSIKYQQAVYVVPPVAASVFFIFLYSLLSFPQFYFEKTKFLMLASIGAAVLNIILNFIFIKPFGFVAAGYTTLVCYILYALGHYIVSKKVLRQKMDNKDIVLVNKKYTFIISIVLILFTFLVNFILPYITIRYMIISILLILIFMKRKLLISKIKELR